ncbi:MAG: aspartate kinase [Draconibacterium sp.]|nr:MAG: aspartate kinase [Draconibacterium sp.]
MKVYKFGGASVKDAAAVRDVSQIIKNEPGKLVVVISAMGKMTNLLEKLIVAYMEKSAEKLEIFKEFKAYHQQIIDDLFGTGQTPERVVDLFTELENKLKKTPSFDYNFEYDQIICFGELVSTSIVSCYSALKEIENQWVDVRDCLRTDDHFRDAAVDWEWTEELSREVFIFRGQQRYITQGFIGSTAANLTTSLGREGSDFTAAILGSILDAESVTIWKDVPGVLSADPKKMEDPLKIAALSYREAVEMAHSGAQVIHPKTMKPLHNKNIPLYVKSFIAPNDPGTVIHTIDYKIQLPPIFIQKENQVLITLTPKDFSLINIEDMDRVVNFLVEERIKVTLIQQSAIDLNLVIDAPNVKMDEILEAFSPYYSILYNTGLTLLTIRHYTEEVLDWMVKEKDIYLEQHSRLTARILVKA